ncbi:MAG: hypothetical protein ACR2P0_05950 [Acidimicrobiales bacterium]
MEPNAAADTNRMESNDRWGLAAILLVATLGALVGWAVSDAGLNSSGLYFIAIPGAMATMLALVPGSGENGRMSGVHGSTIAVLASAIVIREGFICVLLALPLIIPVVVLVSWMTKRDNSDHRRAVMILPLLLVGASGEGVVYDLPSGATASETRVVDATPAEIVDALSKPGELPEIEPLLLRLPFPTPQTFESSGIEVGDVQQVQFDRGAIELEVTNRTETSVVWSVTSNDTPIGEWMTINAVDASWTDFGERTEVTVTIDFDRGLAPAFYFDPLERWGVGEMSEVLIDMIDANL